MNFRPELAEKAMSGEKTVMRRVYSDKPRSPWWRERCSLMLGQVFAVCPGRGKVRICSARVESVDRSTLALDDAEARREGCADAAAFADTIRAIHGDFDPSTGVWRIGFAAITNAIMVTRSNGAEVAEWCGGEAFDVGMAPGLTHHVTVPTPTGPLWARPGRCVYRTVTGEVWVGTAPDFRAIRFDGGSR